MKGHNLTIPHNTMTSLHQVVHPPFLAVTVILSYRGISIHDVVLTVVIGIYTCICVVLVIV